MQKAWAIGTDGVLEWFDAVAREPYYSLWNGKQICFAYADPDQVKGRDLLETNLRAFENQGVTDLFTLKLHSALDRAGAVTDKSPVSGSLNFRPVDMYAQQVGGTTPINAYHNNPGMRQILADLQELKADREAEDLPAEPDPGVLGTINRVLEIPGVQEAVAPLISGLIAKIFPGIPMPAPAAVPSAAAIQPAGSLAGIPQDQNEKIDQALDVLEQSSPTIGDDLLLLANLSQSDPAKFQMMLGALRSMSNGSA